MKLISIVTGCFDEEDNVEPLFERIRAVFLKLPQYRYEHIFIDNCSNDHTVNRIKAIAARDKRVKLIVNTRNFGHIRSPMHGVLAARGDAVILMASDLEDPPELISEFLRRWEAGYKVVVGVKTRTQDAVIMRLVRQAYYKMISRIADIALIQNFTGFGLYDRALIDVVRELDDPYPYFRGIISEVGFEVAEVQFEKPRRARGITKNNFYTLYDMAMLGITSHSKVPIRLATMAGFTLSLLSLAISFTYLVLKLMFWDQFGFGTAPILIGLFFFSSVQLFFIGLIGEYVAAIHTQVLKRPLVVERERVNFDDVQDSGDAPPR
jgi:glycosyltransferase involved in cell wall biosynthesis